MFEIANFKLGGEFFFYLKIFTKGASKRHRSYESLTKITRRFKMK